MSEQNLSITVAMISYNDESIFEDALFSIRNQDYNQDLIDILVIDGGSTDNTIRIAEKYNAKVISRPDLKDHPGVRGHISITIPKTDLILFFSADNRLQETDIFSKMVSTFIDDDVVACETLRYGYKKNDPLLSRYFALIGGVDPIAIGLGKADRGPYDKEGWHSFGSVEDRGSYYKVKFSSDISKIPTIGANGFLIKRSFLEKMDNSENTAHIDMCASLIQKGYNTFAFIKNRHIIHYINIPIIKFLKRRLLQADLYSSDKITRTYSVFHKKDIGRLIWLILTYTTFIFPIFRSIRGYIKHRDTAWFLHPVVCFVFTFGYSMQVVVKLLKFDKNK